METLELKHLAPYLPYGLMMLDRKEIKPLNDVNIASYLIHGCKPIMRPLSDLTEEIEHYGQNINVYEFLKENDPLGNFHLEHDISLENIAVTPYRIIVLLVGYHFDIFGLIEKGLAIDINTIK